MGSPALSFSVNGPGASRPAAVGSGGVWMMASTLLFAALEETPALGLQAGRFAETGDFPPGFGVSRVGLI